VKAGTGVTQVITTPADLIKSSQVVLQAAALSLCIEWVGPALPQGLGCCLVDYPPTPVCLELVTVCGQPGADLVTVCWEPGGGLDSRLPSSSRHRVVLILLSIQPCVLDSMAPWTLVLPSLVCWCVCGWDRGGFHTQTGCVEALDPAVSILVVRVHPSVALQPLGQRTEQCEEQQGKDPSTVWHCPYYSALLGTHHQ